LSAPVSPSLVDRSAFVTTAGLHATTATSGPSQSLQAGGLPSQVCAAPCSDQSGVW
jgi:hypothetical protein